MRDFVEEEEIAALNGNMYEAVTLHSNSVVGRIYCIFCRLVRSVYLSFVMRAARLKRMDISYRS